jgi:hypothetical protein
MQTESNPAIKLRFSGRVVAVGPLVKSGQQIPVAVDQELSVSSDRSACTCELCRIRRTDSQTNPA